jgi:serine/threonine-protein kinase RsbW
MQPRRAPDHADAKSYAQDSVPMTDIREDQAAPDANGFPVPEPESIVLQIPSRPEYVRVVRLALLGIASRLEFSFDDVEDMKLAVSEACNNAILHAAPGYDCDANAGKEALEGTSAASEKALETPGFVKIVVTLYDNRIEITVVDEGYIAPPGLPRPSAAPPHGPDAELRESGLGLYLMQSLMDEVEHHTGANSQTVVRLVKYLPSYKIQAEIEADSQL